MADADREAAVDRLFAVPPEAFVSERTRLSRELRKGGDRPAAAEVAKLRKPSAAAWALNSLAREDPGVVGGWLEAAETLRDASAGGAGDALRAAMREHRAANVRLLEAVAERAKGSDHPLSEAMLDRVRTLLQVATTSAELGEALRAGRVLEEAEPEPAAPELEPDAEPGATQADARSEPAGRRATPSRSPARVKRDRAAKERERKARVRHAELERRRTTASEALERLREEAARLTESARSADERRDEAERSLRRLESEAAAARDAAKDADKAVAKAERELEKLRAGS